ncbi:Non-classical export protein [Lachnellula occidentalis]|uniref:Non-classical export protein n=1 Tax=Lachnellula occidentalis TaxID=215460 RepID=A0A8H8S362_9HELO|nr:Non-classical export protein [Lachnellula occidentalis]
MASIPQMALRAWTFLWTLLTLSLIGNVIASAFAGNPSVVNYSIFVSIFCMLVVLFGIAGVFVESLAIPIALAVADGLAALFSLIAGIALAAELHVHSCGNKHYIQTNHLTNGSHNMGKRCHELQASTAFYWFMFVGFAGSVAMDLIGSSSSLRGRGGMRKGGPSMSQV